MRVVISDMADADIESIGDYIALDSPDRAVTYTDELRDACLGLGDAPLRFAVLGLFERLTYRRRPYGQYSIIYQVGPDIVTIVRVLSTAMDVTAALGGGD